ncbi:hypothetical protein NKR19_g3434 [Coniochaeta hoffmannii]|uniref:Uncharacterized protein n=1 Tax=Coniochaeta hoffmannii TaxID=91930 RepID=A0AA38VY83_9PEZI|nr:hypothetical protein NKR19_g3434 [Coniochaeta hoffmannii]
MESIIKDITPAGDLLVPSSLSTKVRFNAQMSVEDIISTMYHLVYNPHDLLPGRQDDLVARISHAIFTPAHVSDYHILRHKLRALERTFYGVVRLSSVLNTDEEVEIMISRNMASQFSIMLHNELDNAIDPLKQLLNKMDAVAQNQPGPISKWVGDLDINDPDDPRYEYLLAYGTSQKNFPAVVFKLGCSDQEACHLMAEVPIRVVVHIKLEKKAKPGASVVHNNDLTISVWVYDKSARQAKLIQRERLSTPGGQIRLWGSDLMTLEDATLPEKYRRPYKNQEAFGNPNLSISYGAILEAIEDFEVQRTQPVAVCTDESKFARLPCPTVAFSGRTGQTRGFSGLALARTPGTLISSSATRSIVPRCFGTAEQPVLTPDPLAWWDALDWAHNEGFGIGWDSHGLSELGVVADDRGKEKPCHTPFSPQKAYLPVSPTPSNAAPPCQPTARSPIKGESNSDMTGKPFFASTPERPHASPPGSHAEFLLAGRNISVAPPAAAVRHAGKSKPPRGSSKRQRPVRSPPSRPRLVARGCVGIVGDGAVEPLLLLLLPLLALPLLASGGNMVDVRSTSVSRRSPAAWLPPTGGVTNSCTGTATFALEMDTPDILVGMPRTPHTRSPSHRNGPTIVMSPAFLATSVSAARISLDDARSALPYMARDEIQLVGTEVPGAPGREAADVVLAGVGGGGGG